MNLLRILLLFLVITTSLRAAPPRFYFAGQVGNFNADAGSSTQFGPYVDQTIKSGTKTFVDFSVGADFCDWFSLEAGYLDCASFSSQVFVLRPGIETAVAEFVRNTYDLRAYRLTPVFNLSPTDRLSLRFLGGLTHSVGKMVRQGGGMLRVDIDNDSYHAGVGFAYHLTSQATIEARFVHYDFGKLAHFGTRITADTYSIGLSWHF